MLRRLIALVAATFTLVVMGAASAAAHVEVAPGEAVAGSTTTLTFSFHHGKDGTATTGLEVLLPPGASVVEVLPVEGWTSNIDEDTGTVTWTGGPVPDRVKAELPLVVKLPSDPGVALFKTIQTTEAGELAWIEEDESEAEGDYPAPRVVLVADPNATTTTEAPATTAADTTTTERPAGTSLELAQRDDGDNSPAPWLIGSALAAVVAIAVGGTILKRRAG